MAESEQYISKIHYIEGGWRNEADRWTSSLYGNKDGNTIMYSSRDKLPMVVRLPAPRGKWLPMPKPEVRPATADEMLLLIEALPSGLKELRDERKKSQERIRSYGAHLIHIPDLPKAQALSERLIGEAEKRLESGDQVSRLSQVKDSLAKEGLLYKKEQA